MQNPEKRWPARFAEAGGQLQGDSVLLIYMLSFIQLYFKHSSEEDNEGK